MEVNIAMSKPAEGILQLAYMTYDKQKTKLLSGLIKGRDLPSVLIFASAKIKVKSIAKELAAEGFQVADIQSNSKGNKQTGKSTLRFRNRQLQMLVH